MRMCMNEAMFCLRAAGFSGIDLVTGGAVGLAESGLETDQIGRLAGADQVFDNEDLGWMQISTKWHASKLAAATNWRDPFINADLARAVWEEFAAAGKDPWSAWSVYNSGSYKRYLPMAQNAQDHLWAPSPEGSTLILRRRLVD